MRTAISIGFWWVERINKDLRECGRSFFLQVLNSCVFSFNFLIFAVKPHLCAPKVMELSTVRPTKLEHDSDKSFAKYPESKYEIVLPLLTVSPLFGRAVVRINGHDERRKFVDPSWKRVVQLARRPYNHCRLLVDQFNECVYGGTCNGQLASVKIFQSF